MNTKGILRVGRGGFVLFCALTLALGVAKADVPDVVFEVTAEVGPLGVTIPILAEWGEYNSETQTWSWTLPEGEDLEFWSNDTFLGSLTEFEASIVGDPEVNLNFSVQSGLSDTTFHIASALFDDFEPITNAEGYAHASYTLTDFDAGSATLTGVGNTGGAYLAQYNGWAGNPMGPAGTTFAEGIYSMSAGFLETVTEDYNRPESGYLAIDETVESMSSLVSFVLTAQDLASGTTNFVIVPEPGALALLALGAVAFLRRR